MRRRLIKILTDEGCGCDEQHDFPEDATSLNCYASSCLYDLEQLEKEYASFLLRVRAILLWLPKNDHNRRWIEKRLEDDLEASG